MMTASRTVRVLIVDDHTMFRQMLVRALRGDERLQIVGEAASGDQAVALSQSLQPDLIVMDVTMPGMTGVEATRVIHSLQPGVRIVGLSMHNDPAMRQQMLDAGASGYVPKDAPLRQLLDAMLEQQPRSDFS